MSRKTEGERLRALASDVEILAAHVEGLTNLSNEMAEQVAVMEGQVQNLVDLCTLLSKRLGELRAGLVTL